MAWLQGKANAKYASVSVRRPVARTDDLVIEELEDEVLVYDRTNNRAHCLGGTAARVWHACDGSTDVETMSVALGLSREVVQDALDELENSKLLDGLQLIEASNGHTNGNGNGRSRGITRREMTRRSVAVGSSALAAPLIYSVAVNTPIAAATPIPFQCEIYTVQSCGTSDACGHIAGCCCCCQGGGSCKTCGSSTFCSAGTQPCSPVQGGGVGAKCSTVGSTPGSLSGCCGVTGAKSCGCGFGPNAGCCAPGSGGIACTPTDGTTTCFPCCNKSQLTSGAPLGCCVSAFANCCDPNLATNDPGHVACCAASTLAVDCCSSSPAACCATNSC